MTPITTAFVLGAGLGTRLRPLTEGCPKPLLPIGGRSIISYVFDHLIHVGVQNIIINTHHRAERYKEAFPDFCWRGVPLIFKHEEQLLETAGGLKNIGDLIACEERIIVYNADIFSTLPLEKLIEAHYMNTNEVTLALRSKGQPLSVKIDAENRVKDLRNTFKVSHGKSCLFTGIYIVERSFLKRLEAGKIESVVDVWIRMIKQHLDLIGGVVIDEGLWCDIGTKEEYLKLQEEMKHERSFAG